MFWNFIYSEDFNYWCGSKHRNEMRPFFGWIFFLAERIICEESLVIEWTHMANRMKMWLLIILHEIDF